MTRSGSRHEKHPPTPDLSVSVRDARRFLLAHQGLLPPHALEGENGALAYLRRVRCVQFDPLDVVGRNPELVLQARVHGFRREHAREPALPAATAGGRLGQADVHLAGGGLARLPPRTSGCAGAPRPRRVVHPPGGAHGPRRLRGAGPALVHRRRAATTRCRGRGGRREPPAPPWRACGGGESWWSAAGSTRARSTTSQRGGCPAGSSRHPTRTTACRRCSTPAPNAQPMSSLTRSPKPCATSSARTTPRLRN